MNKIKHKNKAYLALSLLTIGCFTVLLPSCNKNNVVVTDTYTITYKDTPNGLTFISKPASTNANTVTITYALASGYSINVSASIVTIAGNDVTSNCTFTSTSLTIPSNLVKGNIVVLLATSLSEMTYSVNYEATSNLNWVKKPSTCKNTEDFIATYTLVSEYIIDTANCSIKAGENDITNNSTFIGGTLKIPQKYITGNLTISLKTKADTFDGKISDVIGGNAKVYTSEDISELGLTLTSVSKIVYVKPTSTDNSSEVSLTLSNNFSNTALYIDQVGTYNITLKDCYLSNTESNNVEAEQPFFVNVKGATINLILSGNNAVIDKRTSTSVSFSQDACIKSKSPLNISGDGSLKVNDLTYFKGINGKGIQTTQNSNLTILSGTLDVFSIDSAIQAAGKIDITGGSIIANSYQEDGIKTKFEDPSDDLKLGSDGNILRDINISGGDVTIYSAKNGINAAHSVNISNNSNVKIYTSKNNAGDKVSDVSISEQDMYIAVPSTSFSYSDIENKFFTITFSGSATTTEYMTLKKIKTIKNASFNEGPQPGPGGGGLSGTYYYFKCDRPLDSQYTSFTINEYDIAQYGLKESKMEASATSSSLSISNPTSTNSKDTVVISSITGGTISTKASTFDSNYKSDIGQNESIDNIVGSKGIKARNEINIDGGETTIKSNDTGIQAGYGSIYFNSTTKGDVTFSSAKVNVTGGSIDITSNNGDGIKSYSEYTISGGSVKVNNSKEALEAGIININGGTTVLFASDDGVNASEVGKYKVDDVNIVVNSGILDVQTTSNSDTDAIDSNNGITINGGLVVARVPGNDSSSAIDNETRTLKMSGNATLITLGNVEPSISGYSKSGTHLGYSKKTYTITYNGGSTYTYTNTMTMNSSGKWFSFNNVSIS